MQIGSLYFKLIKITLEFPRNRKGSQLGKVKVTKRNQKEKRK